MQNQGKKPKMNIQIQSYQFLSLNKKYIKFLVCCLSVNKMLDLYFDLIFCKAIQKVDRFVLGCPFKMIFLFRLYFLDLFNDVYKYRYSVF